jgi:predicted RNA methylase
MTQLSIAEAGPEVDWTRSQFFTDPKIAREMVRMAATTLIAHPSGRILEPSAGRGNLVRAVIEVAPLAHVDAIDIDPRWRADLEALGPGVRFETINYLERRCETWRYDLTITNPPYDDGQEAAHLAKMLDESERIVALLPARSLHGRDRFDRVWSRFDDDGEWSLRQKVHCIGRPKFGERGGSDEIVLLDMRRNDPGGCEIRWL